MSTLVMVRTTCCESYKCNGTRCDICPHRAENREAVKNYQEAVAKMRIGRRFQLPASTTPNVPVSRLVQLEA